MKFIFVITAVVLSSSAFGLQCEEKNIALSCRSEALVQDGDPNFHEPTAVFSDFTRVPLATKISAEGDLLCVADLDAHDMYDKTRLTATLTDDMTLFVRVVSNSTGYIQQEYSVQGAGISTRAHVPEGGTAVSYKGRPAQLVRLSYFCKVR